MVSILHSSLKFLHPRVPASYVFSAPSHFTQNHYGVDFAAPRPSLHQPGPRALPAAEAVKRIVCNYSAACCSDLQPIIVIKLWKCCESSSAGIGIHVKLYPLGRNYIITFNIFQSSLLALWWFSKLVSSYVHACSLSHVSLIFDLEGHAGRERTESQLEEDKPGSCQGWFPVVISTGNSMHTMATITWW